MQTGMTYKIGRDALTKEQVAKLLLSFDRASDKALIHLAIATGIRRLDIVNIKRKDLKCDDGTLTFYEHKKHRTRTITIPSKAAIQSLRIHLDSCKKSKWLFPSPLQGKKYKNAHISDRQAYDILNEQLDKIGLRRIPFHALRATCIKLCDKVGWKVEETAELVGDTVRVVQEHYQTPSIDQMDDLAKKKPII